LSQAVDKNRQMEMPRYGYSGVSRMSSDDLVRGFIADLEKLYGTPSGKCASFNVQEVADARHAEWDDGKNHVTIRIPPRMNDIDRNGQLAHESFHAFSPAKLSEATYLDEGLATLNAKQSQNYIPYSNDAKYCEALWLVEHLIATCSDSIKKLLSLKGRIALVSGSDIVAACKEFPLSVAQLLARKFY
jgi:hypothetical protein